MVHPASPPPPPTPSPQPPAAAAYRWLVLILRGLAVALTLALAALVALIVPSRDNGPFMTAFVVTVTALVTVLVLLGYAGGLRAALDRAPAPTDPPAERPG